MDTIPSRNRNPSSKVLEAQCEEIEQCLNSILELEISKIESHDSLVDSTAQCKYYFKQYCDINFKLVEYKNSVGALSEADELKQARQLLKKEVKEFISLVNSALGDAYKDISFNSTLGSLSTFSQTLTETIQTVSPNSVNAVFGDNFVANVNKSEAEVSHLDQASNINFASRVDEPLAAKPLLSLSVSTSLLETVTKPASMSIDSVVDHFSSDVPPLLSSSPVQNRFKISSIPFNAYDDSQTLGIHTCFTPAVSSNTSTTYTHPTPAVVSFNSNMPSAPTPVVVSHNSGMYTHPTPAVVSSNSNMHLAPTPVVASHNSGMYTLPASTVGSPAQNMHPTPVVVSHNPGVYTLPASAVGFTNLNMHSTPAVVRLNSASNTLPSSTVGSISHVTAFPVVNSAMQPPTNLHTVSTPVNAVPNASQHNLPTFIRNNTAAQQLPNIVNQNVQAPSFSVAPPSVPVPTTSFPSHNLHPPLHNYSNQPRSDVLTNYILKSQLFKKVGQPFNGEAHKYHTWVNVMQRQMSGLSLDPWDILTILYENTEGKPKKVIENFMNIGAVDPHTTLVNTWNALYEQFGTSSRISSAINNQLESFPIIKSQYNTEKLRELINICRIISANMSTAEELRMFNMSVGLRKIWLKLPDRLQNGWRSKASELQQSQYNSPSLSDLIAYLENKHREYSNLSYTKQLTTQEFPKSDIDKKTTLKTDSKTGPVQNEKEHKVDKDAACPVHPTGKHHFHECLAFAKMTGEEKNTLINKNKRCYICLGPHLKSSCPRNITCKICQGKHATAVHREPSNSKFQNSECNNAFNETVGNLCTAVCGGNKQRSCSKVLLVDVNLPSKSSKSLRCYAIIDEQSSTSFADPKIAEFFEVDMPQKEYTIRTLTGLDTLMSGVEISGLRVKGVNQNKSIYIPPIVTTDCIPDCKSEVATPQDVMQHKHIAHLSKYFPPYDSNAEVLLLLGRDCSAAMATDCVARRAPYAHRTPVGWALVGIVCKSKHPQSSTNTVLKVQMNYSSYEHMEAFPAFPKDNCVKEILRNPFAHAPS